MNPGHPFRSLCLAAAALVAAGVACAAAETGAGRSNVSRGVACIDAMLVAARHEGRTVVRTAGGSMLPFFGPDSVAVMQRIAPERLRAGMIAVYRNADNERVAHRVVARDGGGWRVQGFNNSRPDSTLVGPSNLEGILYAVFHTAGGTGESPGSFAVWATLPVVLGAPAK